MIEAILLVINKPSPAFATTALKTLHSSILGLVRSQHLALVTNARIGKSMIYLG